MTTRRISRRNFIKLGGLAAVALPAIKVHAKSGDSEIVSSKSAYGGFMVRRHTKEAPPYQLDKSKYRRFDQKNECFSRAFWDEDYKKSIKFADLGDVIKQNKSGFRREDFAFQAAAWNVANALGTMSGSIGGFHTGLYSMGPLGGMTTPFYSIPPWKPGDLTPQEVTDIVKKATLFFGASLVGVTQVDERWVYSRYYDIRDREKPGRNGDIVFEEAPAASVKDDGTMVIPKSMKHVISIAFEMDEDGINTYMGGPASAATGNGYSRMAFTASCLAEFLRGLGYKALPCGNNTALSIPIAIDAGLGELGRLGLLVTPKYGPRVRLAKVFTDMPLVPDAPISFGVTEFCEVCGKCAEHCPGNAISKTKRTTDTIDMSNNPGVLKWPSKHTNCLRYWRETGLDCGSCIRSCPFNKAEGWLHEATRALIGLRSGTIGQMILKMDDASGYGKQQDSTRYWKKDRFIHIKNI